MINLFAIGSVMNLVEHVKYPMNAIVKTSNWDIAEGTAVVIYPFLFLIGFVRNSLSIAVFAQKELIKSSQRSA